MGQGKKKKRDVLPFKVHIKNVLKVTIHDQNERKRGLRKFNILIKSLRLK